MNTEQTKDCELCQKRADEYDRFNSPKEYYDYLWNTYRHIGFRFTDFVWYWLDCLSPEQRHARLHKACVD
jgi:hypothetical protein